MTKLAVTSMTSAENAPRLVDTPMRAVGMNFSTASKRVFW